MLLSRRRQKLKEFKPEQSISKMETVDYEEMTKAEIKAILDTKGIKFSDRDNKSKLIELLK